ncbi:MAG: tetratricopeptide repeat protein [Methanosarcina sp.]
MSRQAIDSAIRILGSVPDLIEKGDYTQAFEKAEKAQKLAEKVNVPDLIHWALMAKGEALDAACRLEEAVETYERALAFSSDLFLEDTKNIHHQEILYSTIGNLGKTLEELDSVIKARQVCKKAGENFEKVLKAYKTLLANNPENSEYLPNYLKTMGNVWACYMVAEDLEKQIPLVPETLQTYGKIIDSDSEDPENYLRLDNVVKKFGEACLKEGRFEEAKQAYEQAHAIYKNIHEKYPENRLALNFLLFSYDYFGKLYTKMGESDKVEAYYLQSLELAEEQLKKDPEDLSIILNMGKICQDLGIFYSEAEELEKAKVYYEKALAYYEGLIGKRPEDPEYSYHLTRTFNRLAEDFGDISSVEKAKECYLHEIEIYESLIESEIDDIDNELNIAETFSQISGLYDGEEDTESAKEYYEKKMMIYERLFSEFPEETEYELYIADTFNELGDLYFEKEEIPARQYYEKALEIAEKAVERDKTDALSLSSLLSALKNLADLNKVYKHYEAAIPFQQRALDIQLEIQNKYPKNWMYIRDAGSAFSELGLLFEKVGDTKQATQLHSNAVEMFSKVIFGGEDPSIKKRLAIEIQLRGYTYLRSKRYISAKPYMELAHKYYESASEQEPNDRRALEGLFSVLYETGLLNYGMENFEEAIENYKTAFSVLDKLTELSPEKLKQKANEVKLHIGLGMSYSALKELEKSKEAFEKALATNSELLEKEPENIFFLEDKAITLGEYANLLLKTGRTSEAETYKTESAEIFQKVDAKESNLMKLQRNIADI